jgi:hypothetical protein
MHQILELVGHGPQEQIPIHNLLARKKANKKDLSRRQSTIEIGALPSQTPFGVPVSVLVADDLDGGDGEELEAVTNVVRVFIN